MLESLSFSVCNLWQKRQLHINTDFVVTVCMLCVIPHIRKDAKYHSDIDHRKQVNNVIKKLFSGASEEKIDVTQDIFWTEYTEFDNKVGSFDAFPYKFISIILTNLVIKCSVLSPKYVLSYSHLLFR